MIFIYAVYRKDPVLLVGHLMGAVIYFRNILILKKEVTQKKRNIHFLQLIMKNHLITNLLFLKK